MAKNSVICEWDTVVMADTPQMLSVNFSVSTGSFRRLPCKTVMAITMHHPMSGTGKNWQQKCDSDFGMRPVLEAKH